MMVVFVIFMVVVGVLAGAHQPLSPGEDSCAPKWTMRFAGSGATRTMKFPGPSCGTSEVPIYLIYLSGRLGYDPFLQRVQVVRVLTKANPDFWLTIRDGYTVLVHADPIDEFQQWVMDETYSTKVKDEAGYPSFSLVNKATGQALKHGFGETEPVLLTPYEPHKYDESILWTTSGDMGQGFKAIRLLNNIQLNLDAFHGDKKSGGIKDGNPVVLWSWNKGDNQLWKILPL